MSAYYNENDPDMVAWLEELIKDGLLPDGVVDGRSIVDVDPSDLRGFRQCHFFAGIGIWPYALHRAGFPDDRPVWTGSCPCQPFSTGGLHLTYRDERHLWPTWFGLIGACRPGLIFGEQISGAKVIGTIGRPDGKEPEAPRKWAWIDHVRDDLESAQYAFGSVSFAACSVGAPHHRQRLFFVADTDNTGSQGWPVRHGEHAREQPAGPDVLVGKLGRAGATNGRWADADWIRCREQRWRPVEPGTQPLVDRRPKLVGSGRIESVAWTPEARQMRLRGYGNAIVTEQAVAWVAAYMDGE